MPRTHVYETRLCWSMERKGLLSSEGFPSIEVATPPEFPKGHPGIWTPEHLYVAAAEICLMTTFLAVAEKANLEFTSYASTATGELEKTIDGFIMTRILIKPSLTIKNESDRERARDILEKSEQHCLISNSMKTDVTIEPFIEVEA